VVPQDLTELPEHVAGIISVRLDSFGDLAEERRCLETPVLP
jgi:hypothetical protein